MSVSSVPPSGSTTPLAFPGAILAGRYRLEEVVGQGGMGSVWRATHTGLGEQVALKLVSAAFARSREALRRFDTEAKAAAKLRSRHVPQVFDNGVLEDGTPFLVMELLHGESLAARIHRLGPIPLPETVTIVEQCCRALGRAHSLGIVHRDIKPENIYLAHSVDDDAYIVKILDFGIAKVASPLSEDGRSSTRTGTLLGTPLYMSPEQARGLRSIDFRTDLYSLGLVSYTMLTGRLPFSGETLGDLLLQICAEPLPTLRASAPVLPPSMEDWFRKACARTADERFPSAQGMVEAMRVAAGISASTQPDGGFPASLASSEGGLMGAPKPPLDAKQLATLHASSTTGGALLATNAPNARRTRWIAVGAAAVVGLAVVPLIALFARGKGPAAAGVSASQAMSAATAAPPTSPEMDAAPAAVLAPLTTESSVRPGSSATAVATTHPPDRPATPVAHSAARPGTNTAPSAPAGKPTTTRPTTKPAGGIDLGY